jgi:hypothetical protein
MPAPRASNRPQAMMTARCDADGVRHYLKLSKFRTTDAPLCVPARHREY